MTPEMEEKIARIPRDGWWKSASQDMFKKSGEKMINRGLSEEETLSILEDLYFATADCFGG